MEGKVYAVTGGASGIGQAVVVRLAELGARGVAVSDVNLAGLEKTKQLCEASRTEIVCTEVDVSKSDQVEKWIEDTVNVFGQIDGAANVAGIAWSDEYTTCQTIRQKDWDRMLNINLNGVMHCMRAQLPHLPRPGGAIVNVSSTAGIRGFPGNSAYATAKFGVIGLTRSAAGEFGKEGIRVNALLPGPIDTPLLQDRKAMSGIAEKITNGTCLGRLGKPHEVAKVLCFLLSDDASFVTGGTLALYTKTNCLDVDLTLAQRNGRWTGGTAPVEAPVSQVVVGKDMVMNDIQIAGFKFPKLTIRFNSI